MCGKPSVKATSIPEFLCDLFFPAVSWSDCILHKGGDCKAFLNFPFLILPWSLKNEISFCFLKSSCIFIPVQRRTQQNTHVTTKLKKTPQAKQLNFSTTTTPLKQLLVAKFSVLGASQSTVCKTAYRDTLVLGQSSQ